MEREVHYTTTSENLRGTTPIKNDLYTVVLCHSGSTSMKVGFHSFELEAKTIAIIPPNTLFSTAQPSDDLVVEQLYFSKNFLQKLFLKEEVIDELLLLNSDYPPRYELLERFDLVSDRFQAIKRELNTQYAYHLDLVRLILMEILYEYNRACEYCLLGFEKNMNRNYQLTYEFKKLVDVHFSTWKSLGTYASHLNISAKHLTEVVKEETGHTALQLIHERLLLESQYYLKHTTYSIKECASLLGFETASYFSRFFKSQMNSSPNEFRKRP